MPKPKLAEKETLVDVIEIRTTDGERFEFELYRAIDGSFYAILHPNMVNSNKWVTNLELQLYYREGYICMSEGEYKLVCTSHTKTDPKLYHDGYLHEALDYLRSKFPDATANTINAVIVPFDPDGTIL